MLGTDSTSFAIARYLAEEPAPVLSLVRVRLSGDYERGNPCRYWGQGAPLYRAVTDDGELTLHCRAATRDQAKAAILARIKGATFKR